MHLVLLTVLVVVGHLLAAYQDAKRIGNIEYRYPKIGGALAVDIDPEFGLSDDQRRVDVYGARYPPHLRDGPLRVFSELLKIRPGEIVDDLERGRPRRDSLYQ